MAYKHYTINRRRTINHEKQKTTMLLLQKIEIQKQWWWIMIGTPDRFTVRQAQTFGVRGVSNC